MLGGNSFSYPNAPASQVGSSSITWTLAAQSALQPVTLDGRGSAIRMRYNAGSGDIEFLNGHQLRFSISMD